MMHHSVKSSSAVATAREDYALAFVSSVSALVRHAASAAHQESAVAGAVAAGSVEALRDAAAAAAAAGRLWRLLPCIRILVF